MDNYIGKICPYCNKEIIPGDMVKVCPNCNTPHHESCWDKNEGCTTFGCKEQRCEKQTTDQSEVCLRCGSPLEDGQMFCPKCGAKKNTSEQNTCLKCGNLLLEGQEFCPKCGHKVGLAVDINSNLASAEVKQTKINTKAILPIIGFAAIVLIIFVIFSSGGKSDFNKMFGEYAEQSWCYISDDGSYMEIDTNPFNYDDYFDADAHLHIETINSKLGFSSALMSKMGKTSALDGRLTESNKKYSVSWTFHPDYGLEVIYEVNK